MPSDKIVFLTLLFFSPALILLTHFVVARGILALKINISPLLTAGFAVLLGYFLSASISWVVYLNSLTQSEFLWAGLYGTLVYGGLAFSYFQFFAMTETARRIHILREIFTRGRVKLKELERDYGGPNMLSIRLERMVELKQLRREHGLYRVQGRLLLVVGTITYFWAKVLGFRQKGTG